MVVLLAVLESHPSPAQVVHDGNSAVDAEILQLPTCALSKGG